MPRLVNAVTGVTVNCDDATAANLDSNWSAVKVESEEKPTRRTSK